MREVREETAWQFEPQGLLGVYLWRNRQRAVRPCVSPSPARCATTTPPSASIWRSSRTHWLSPPELAARAGRLRSPLVMRCIEDYLVGAPQELAAVSGVTLETAITVAPTAQL